MSGSSCSQEASVAWSPHCHDDPVGEGRERGAGTREGDQGIRTSGGNEGKRAGERDGKRLTTSACVASHSRKVEGLARTAYRPRRLRIRTII